MKKRKHPEFKQDYSTLAVFTYYSNVAACFVPSTERQLSTHTIVTCLFGKRAHTESAMFSCSVTPEGVFFLLDRTAVEALDLEPYIGRHVESANDLWRCLYIHESSETRNGSEVFGTLAALTAQLAAAQVPVLNMTSLERNFMLVRAHHADAALKQLQETLEGRAHADSSAMGLACDLNKNILTAASPRLELLPESVAMGSFPSDKIPQCAHALISILLYSGSAFCHLFELGGEVSLIMDESSLAALSSTHLSSANVLLSAIGDSIARNWRVLSIGCPAGSETVGILSAICLPLASLPIMNVSTLERNFLLIKAAQLEQAIELLAPHFEVARPVPAYAASSRHEQQSSCV